MKLKNMGALFLQQKILFDKGKLVLVLVELFTILKEVILVNLLRVVYLELAEQAVVLTRVEEESAVVLLPWHP